jgi:hypothetical protein
MQTYKYFGVFLLRHFIASKNIDFFVPFVKTLCLFCAFCGKKNINSYSTTTSSGKSKPL